MAQNNLTQNSHTYYYTTAVLVCPDRIVLDVEVAMKHMQDTVDIQYHLIEWWLLSSSEYYLVGYCNQVMNLGPYKVSFH